MEGLDCFLFHLISTHFVLDHLALDGALAVCDISTISIQGGVPLDGSHTDCPASPCLMSLNTNHEDDDEGVHDGNVTITLMTTNPEITRITARRKNLFVPYQP